MKLYKKSRFRFIWLKKKKNYLAFLIFKQVHSNFFITLVDKKFKVITCITSGNSKVGDSIRQKCSPYSMEKICWNLYQFLKLYRIQALNIYLHTRPIGAFFLLMQQLLIKRISVVRIYEHIHVPHNGIRPKNIRRK